MAGWTDHFTVVPKVPAKVRRGRRRRSSLVEIGIEELQIGRAVDRRLIVARFLKNCVEQFFDLLRSIAVKQTNKLEYVPSQVTDPGLVTLLRLILVIFHLRFL